MSPRGRALHVDGSLASWYAPGRITTGSVWDALAAPLLLLPRSRRRRVLVLGLGGGSAARIVRALAPRAQIVGVERDAEVVRAARGWLDLDELGIKLEQADARDYLARSRRRFDAILEDVFVGRGRGVHKPAWMLDRGLRLAARRLAPGGLLVSNTLDETAAVARRLRGMFPAIVRIDVADYDNRILVGGPPGLSGHTLRSVVRSDAILAASGALLSFRTVSSR